MPTDTVIADRIEIADLFSRLANLLDERRWEDIRSIYTDDVAARSPRGQLHGLDEVIAFLRKSKVAGEHTQHMTSDVLVDVDGDQASASAKSVVRYYRDDRPPHQASGLRLAYTAVRTPVGWRFREARIELAWTQQNF